MHILAGYYPNIDTILWEEKGVERQREAEIETETDRQTEKHGQSHRDR